MKWYTAFCIQPNMQYAEATSLVVRNIESSIFLTSKANWMEFDNYVQHDFGSPSSSLVGSFLLWTI